MINEQELAAAVDRLREGEQVLGISDCSICHKMSQSESFVAMMFFELANKSNVQEMFEEKFNEIARYELHEALRAKQEVSNGLL